MNSGMGRRLWVVVVLLVPVLALLTGARNMPRLEAPGDLAGAVPGETILVDVLANDGVLGEGLVLLQVSPPQRGTAVIEGDQVRYTAASSEGDDRFGYMVQLADGRKALGVVDVRVRSLPLGTHLKGLVPAHVGAGATVRLRMGQNVVHETLTRADGHFTVVWPTGIYDSSTLMSVEVKGHTRAGVPATWHSVVGTVGAFPYGWWGPDDEAHWNLRVGPFSTAHHALLSRVMALPGGSGATYLAHHSSVDPLMLLRVATVFSMLAEGEVPLPAGKSDIYALIEDLGALDALVDALPSGVFQARQSALLADRRMIQQYGSSLEQLHAEGSLMAPAGAGMIALAGEEVAELSGLQYTLRPPRTSTWIQRVDDAGWQRLVMDEPTVELAPNSRLMQCEMGMTRWYRVLREWDEETLVGLFRGDDVSYMLRLRDVTESAIEEGLLPECMDSIPAPVVAAERVPAVVYDTGAGEARRAGFHPGRHHLAATTSAADRTPRAGWVDVDAGTAGFDDRSLSDTPFWTNGSLLAFQLDDPWGGLADHAASLVRQSTGAQEWLVRVDSSLGDGASVFSTTGVNADPDLGAVDFAGVWMNGLTVSELSLGRPGVPEFRIVLDVANGTGSQISQQPGGVPPQVEPMSLSVADTTMSGFNFRTSTGDVVAECPPGDFGCAPWRTRDWQVLRVLHDHFGAGQHLMWVDERLRLGFLGGEWAIDLRRVMAYVLTDEPLPDVADAALEHAVPMGTALEGTIDQEKGRMRH